MSEKHILLLLQLIKHRSNIDSLLNNGLEYSQIARLLSQVKSLGLVRLQEEEGLALTESGENRLKELIKKFTDGKSCFFIEPDCKHTISKLKEHDIYIPGKGKVNFE